LTLVFVASLLLFAWRLSRLKVRCQAMSHSTLVDVEDPARHLGIARLFLAAVVMLCLTYVVSFTHFPPIAKYGRETAVHLAAAFGASLLFACGCSVFVSIATACRLKNYPVFVLALYFSLAVAYRFSIQLDFKQAWQNQRAFWNGVVPNVPDLTDGTIVFVLDHDLPRTRYILTNSWADAIILSQVFQFPSDWKNPPRLFVVHKDWTDHLVREGDQFKWEVPMATWLPHWEVLPNANVILLEMDHGKLVRRFGSFNIKGQNLDLKPVPPGAKLNWEKGALYDYLIEKARYQSFRRTMVSGR
jgi:hypothetical protein